MNNWHLGAATAQRFDWIGYDILVFHIGDGQIQSDPAADAGRVASAGIDDVFTNNIALFSKDFPLTGWTHLDIQNSVVSRAE